MVGYGPAYERAGGGVGDGDCRICHAADWPDDGTQSPAYAWNFAGNVEAGVAWQLPSFAGAQPRHHAAFAAVTALLWGHYGSGRAFGRRYHRGKRRSDDSADVYRLRAGWICLCRGSAFGSGLWGKGWQPVA